MGAAIDAFRRTRFFAFLKQRIDGPLPSYLWLRARGGLHYLSGGHLIRSRALRQYLASTTEPRLQVGSGVVRLSGWLNSDLISGDIHLDLSRPFPLPASTFKYAFGEHVIEHISERQGRQLLRELYRI